MLFEVVYGVVTGEGFQLARRKNRFISFALNLALIALNVTPGYSIYSPTSKSDRDIILELCLAAESTITMQHAYNRFSHKK